MNSLVDGNLLPAWSDSVHDAQATFRAVLKALAEPGSIQRLPVDIEGPAPFDSSTTALVLALADFETPVWLAPDMDVAAVQSYLRFHCGCPLTSDASHAAFAILAVAASSPPLMLRNFAQGSMEYPDRSATLLIQVPSLYSGPARTLSGSGIAATRMVQIDGLPDDFNTQWDDNAAGFPLGVDVIFCCDGEIAGLPRTTRIFR